MPVYLLIFITTFLVTAQGQGKERCLTLNTVGDHVMVTRKVNGEQVELNTSATRWSEEGIYQVTLRSHLTPLKINRMHSWTVTIQDAEERPVITAVISVGGGMPEHNHGLPTAPRVTQNLGTGDYLLEGMRFNMGGWWEIRLQITAGENVDTVVFNCILPE